MKVLSIDERKDGSAILNVDLTEREVTMLIEKGFITLLEEYTEIMAEVYDESE